MVKRMNIVFESVLSEETILRAREWHWKKFGFSQHWWTIGGIILIFIGVMGLLGENPLLGIMLIGYGTYCVLRKSILKRHFLRQFRSSPHAGKCVRTTIFADGIRQEFDNASSELKWSSFHETISTPDGYLLYLQKNHYIWLPLNDIKEDGDHSRIRDLLEANTRHRAIA